MSIATSLLSLGDVRLQPEIREGLLYSLGAVHIGQTPLRNPATRFLPWFDNYDGDVFRRFSYRGCETHGEVTVLALRAISDPDVLFREQRDCSGDPCFRNANWDADPLEAELRICLQPQQVDVDGRSFTGFKYWFEYQAQEIAIHRLIDRQTWEVGGNLGWWQIDYSDGSMRPQYDKMAQLYAELTHAGLYIMPEAIVTFSNHSCCGMHGGNVYDGELLGYAYNTNFALEGSAWLDGSVDGDLSNYEERLISGQEPIDLFFRCIAHKRVPSLHFHGTPRESWDAQRVAEMKEVLAVYRQYRHAMKKRTVLKEGAGVRWEDDLGNALLFSFKAQSYPGKAVDAATGVRIADGNLLANHAYRLLED